MLSDRGIVVVGSTRTTSHARGWRGSDCGGGQDRLLGFG
jgi:hypothetical protein